MSHDPAKTRFFIMSVTRLTGVIFVMLGIAILADLLSWPDSTGWVLLAIGLADFFLLPLLLARKWRTPPE